jgi:hypothetical protein
LIAFCAHDLEAAFGQTGVKSLSFERQVCGHLFLFAFRLESLSLDLVVLGSHLIGIVSVLLGVHRNRRWR